MISACSNKAGVRAGCRGYAAGYSGVLDAAFSEPNENIGKNMNQATSIEALVAAEQEKICRHYRITSELAGDFIRRHLLVGSDLPDKIASMPRRQVQRLASYQKAIKAARKEIYYYLRRYHRQDEAEREWIDALAALPRLPANPERLQHICAQLLQSHLSTRERYPAYPDFYCQLAGVLPSCRTILDLGCGMHPLSFPFSQYPDLTYCAIDRDPEVIRILTLFAPQVLPTRLLPCVNRLESLVLDSDFSRKRNYDLVLMLKLLPVIYRQNRQLFPALAAISGGKLLVTASSEAMTRHQNIARREQQILHEFISISGRQIAQEIRLTNEFGYLLV